jgi:catalase
MEYLNANFQGDRPMKPNRLNQRNNLVAGIWMPPTLMLLGVALVAPIDFRAAPDADKDLAQQIFDTMVQLPGNKPGNRLVHAKGIVCQGTFAASKNAAAISQAGHFNGDTIPVIVRFSDNGPDPGIADISPDSAPRGMAIRFKLPDGKETDIVAFSHNGFPVGTGEEFLGLQKAIVATDPTKPHPWPVEMFLSTRPRALKFVQDPKPTPVSFATEAFFGNNSWIFINRQGIKQAGRYEILPVAGQHYVSDADGKSKTPNFLIEELKTHLVQEPVKFRFLLQLPNPGDSTNDASIVWPADRKTIDLGTITITAVDPDSDAAQKALAFDPTRLTDGIELSDDPLPALRSRVYRLSRIHRQGQ